MRRIGLVLLVVAAAVAVYRLRPDASGRAARDRPGTDGGPGAPTPRPSPAADPAPPAQDRTLLRGRVLGPDDRPRARAAIDVMGRRGPALARAVADDAGRFEVEVPPATPLRCFVQADGCPPDVHLVEVPAGRTVERTFRLRPGLVIRGRVVDATDVPVAGISLGARFDQRIPRERALAMHRHYPVWTDSGRDGRFEVGPLFAGRHRLEVEYGEGELVVEGVEAGRTDVRIVIPATPPAESVRVRVRVVDPAGEPVPRCGVWLKDANGRGTNAEYVGEVLEIHHRGQGPFHLRAHAPTDAEGAPLPYAPGVLEGATSRAEPYVVRLRPGYPVQGTILVDGEPGAYYVSITYTIDGGSRVHATVRSDDEGRFAFDGVAAGPAAIFLADDVAYLPGGKVEVEAGRTDVVVRARRVAKLEVKVTGPRPLAVAVGTVWELTPGGKRPARWEMAPGVPRASPHLVLRFNWIYPDRRYELEVRARTRSGWLATRRIEFDGDTGSMDVRLEEGPRVRGTVVREDGAPVLYAEVRAVPPGEYAINPYNSAGRGHVALPQTATDRDGRFELTGLPGDPVTLFAFAPGLVQAHDAPTVGAGRDDVRIVLRPAGVITGRVEGDALDDLIVEPWPAGGQAALILPTEVPWSRFFEAELLAPGVYRLVVRGTGPGDNRFAISDPVEAGTRGVRVVLSTGSILEGALVEPVEGVRIRVDGPWARRFVDTDAAGRWTVLALPAGLYTVTATHCDGRTAAAEARTGGGPVTLRLK